MQAELAAQRDRETSIEAAALAAAAVDGVVVDERDGYTNDELRRLALATRDALAHGVVGLVGTNPDRTSATVAVAISRDLVADGVSAASIALPAARVLGGGTGKKATEVAVGGGRNVAAVGEARAELDRAARAVLPREPTAPVGTAGDR